MARLDWALVCDHAYFDSMDRLCMLGVLKQLPTLGLPETIPQAILVGHLVDLSVVEKVPVSVSVTTPSGFLLCAEENTQGMSIEMVGEYVVVVMRGLPITEEGNYSFTMQIGDQAPLTIELPVNDVTRGLPASVH